MSGQKGNPVRVVNPLRGPGETPIFTDKGNLLGSVVDINENRVVLSFVDFETAYSATAPTHYSVALSPDSARVLWQALSQVVHGLSPQMASICGIKKG